MAASPGPEGQRPRKERAGNAAMRRRQIIEATLASIEKNGLAGTTLATVSKEAGLSQGVAVFYFDTKQALLEAALRALYAEYEDSWQRALESAGPDPVDRIVALVASEFDPAVCTPRALAVWHAFWGEASARPLYAEIASGFDAAQGGAMKAAILELADVPDADAETLQTGIGALTDGLWMHMHLSQGAFTRAMALDTVRHFLKVLFPGHAAAFDRAFQE